MGRGKPIKHPMPEKKSFFKIIGPFFVMTLIVSASLFPVCSVWPAGLADTLVVDVEGTGVIERQNLSRAREKAIENALSQALKSAVASMLAPGLRQERIEEAWRAVSANRGNCIQRYAITGETSDGVTYRIGANVTLLTGILSEKLRSLGYETVQPEVADREVILTVNDVRSHEEYAQLRAFLKGGVPCISQVRPVRFSWREVSFQLTLKEASRCVTEVQLPFVVRDLTDDTITGEIKRRK